MGPSDTLYNLEEGGTGTKGQWSVVRGQWPRLLWVQFRLLEKAVKSGNQGKGNARRSEGGLQRKPAAGQRSAWAWRAKGRKTEASHVHVLLYISHEHASQHPRPAAAQPLGWFFGKGIGWVFGKGIGWVVAGAGAAAATTTSIKRVNVWERE